MTHSPHLTQTVDHDSRLVERPVAAPAYDERTAPVPVVTKPRRSISVRIAAAIAVVAFVVGVAAAMLFGALTGGPGGGPGGPGGTPPATTSGQTGTPGSSST